jgi:hypothetical protein
VLLRDIRDDLDGRIRQWLESIRMEEDATRGHRLARRIA